MLQWRQPLFTYDVNNHNVDVFAEFSEKIT